MFPYFDIFGRTIGSYAICAFVGFFVSVFVATKLAKTIKLAFEDVILIFLAVGGGILVGGHLLYALTNIDKIIKYSIAVLKNAGCNGITFEHIKGILSECFGGSVFYGGFIGGTLALMLYMRCAKIDNKSRFTDIFAVCVPLFHTFGRIGCFLGGCCYGIESKIGFVFNNELLPQMSGVRRFPVALVESAFNLFVFIFILYLYKNKKQTGKLIFVYMLIYPVGRFVLEFLRGDEIRGIFLCLSTSQWISVVLFVIGVFFIKKKRKIFITQGSVL